MTTPDVIAIDAFTFGQNMPSRLRLKSMSSKTIHSGPSAAMRPIVVGMGARRIWIARRPTMSITNCIVV